MLVAFTAIIVWHYTAKPVPNPRSVCKHLHFRISTTRCQTAVVRPSRVLYRDFLLNIYEEMSRSAAICNDVR
jgi:hypothetical protein